MRSKVLMLLCIAAVAQHRHNDGCSAHAFSLASFVRSVHVARSTKRLGTRPHNRCKRSLSSTALGCLVQETCWGTNGCELRVRDMVACTSAIMLSVVLQEGFEP